jgi:membrane fusion protein (multidrug efflux system)
VSDAFSRSLRSLAADRSARMLWGLVLGGCLLAGWMLWAVLARVPVYEVSEDARLEVVGGRHVVQAPVAGAVVDSTLVLGAPVERGQLLVRLDAAELEKALEEKQAEKKALELDLAALRQEQVAVRDAMGAARRAESAAVDEARAAEDAALPEAELAKRRAARLSQRQGAAFSEAELDEARSLAAARQKALTRMKRGVARLEWDHRSRLSDRLVELQRLEREEAILSAGVKKLAVGIEGLLVAIDKRRIVAPHDGVLGRITELSAGAFVEEGAPLCTVVPERAQLKVVAQFRPSAAVGRIAPGQQAQLRFHGFPWAQYGRVPAEVVSIGSEAPDGKLRVELSVKQEASSVPLQHGLGTAVDVEVERISPATMLLRAAGKLVEPSSAPLSAVDEATGDRG